MTVAVVIAAAAVAAPPATIRNSEHALDRTHRTTHTGPYSAADHTAHGAGNPVTFVRTFLRAAYNALRTPELGDCEQGKHDGRNRKIELDGQTGRQNRCLGLNSHHLNSLNSAAIAPARRDSVTP